MKHFVYNPEKTNNLVLEMKMKWFWFFLSFTLVLGLFAVREFDDPYGRSINGDGKGYYAYLPALLIYGDSSFGFIDSIEKKYYPSDGSQFKNFLNKQPNGKYVNKTFPGLSLLYAPFFLLAYVLSFIFGFPLDGYSVLFQWGIAFSHVVYFLFGAYYLWLLFKRLHLSNGTFILVISSLCFASNCWFYIIYDHSVSHIHSFFLASLLLYLMTRWLQDKGPHIFGYILLVMGTIVITRPTNAIMLLFFFLLTTVLDVALTDQIRGIFKQWKKWIGYALLALIVLIFPLLLWKWQSGYWLVYSYANEGFDFLHPYFFDFLFSFKKGWFLWSPWLLVLFCLSLFYFIKESITLFFSYVLPLLVAVYILSSWWCWTFGTGFGQRPMIEFLPFMGLGIALILDKRKRLKVYLSFLLLPFIVLSLIQGFQITNSILKGGETTKEEYWKYFLQVKRDAPEVDNRLDAFILKRFVDNKTQLISDQKQYSSVVISDSLVPDTYVVLRIKVSGEHGDKGMRLVVSGANGDFYKAIFLGDYLYKESRQMEFLVKVKQQITQPISCYLWNGGATSRANVDMIEMVSLKSCQDLDSVLSVLHKEKRVNEE